MQAMLYHAHHNQDLEDLPFWLELAKKQGGPILELGCGTGRITLPLVQAGYHLTGLDMSAEMLAYQQMLASQAGIKSPELVQADMTQFNLNRHFPLVILPCNTYSTLNQDQRKNTLTCVRRHLTSNGMFAASMPNPEWLAELEDEQEIEIETVFLHPETGNPVQASNEWRRHGEQLEICWHYDHLLPDGQVERFSQSTSHWLISADVYVEEMNSFGFEVKTYGDFDFQPFTPEQPFLVFTAHLGDD